MIPINDSIEAVPTHWQQASLIEKAAFSIFVGLHAVAGVHAARTGETMLLEAESPKALLCGAVAVFAAVVVNRCVEHIIDVPPNQ